MEDPGISDGRMSELKINAEIYEYYTEVDRIKRIHLYIFNICLFSTFVYFKLLTILYCNKTDPFLKRIP